jgi:site-specific DNA-methyltransferase (adenine-specific)
MATSKTINGDCLEELKKLDDNSIDLLCTDPPYGYGFMGKHWDTFQEKQSTKSQTVGWMSPGMKKSTYGMKEFFVPIWEESLRVVKPGGFAFVMSAPRSDVQMVMVQTLQEAGFDVSFTPIYWTYATGFPKAMNIGKAVDKRMGAERKVVGKKKNKLNFNARDGSDKSFYDSVWDGGSNVDLDITEPKSEEAKKLDGSYAGYQPKPAVEVVIVAMKPLEQKGYLDQALDNQKGITWLDDCRIPFGGMSDKEKFDKDNVAGQMNFDGRYEKDSGKMYEGGWDKPMRNTTNRKPREENTVFKSSGFKSENNDTAEASPLGRFTANLLVSDDTLEEDFSRYYSLDAWWEDRLQKLPNEVKRTFPFLIVPKASKSEKNNGLEKFEKQEKIFNGQSDKPSTDMKGVEKKFTTQPSQNIHPTVKPTTLMSYLVTLGSRKGDVVLDPFGGSGTTAISCVFSERNYILIEREKEYYEILKARIKKAENPAGLVINEWF